MKITSAQLQQIIKEELEAVLDGNRKTYQDRVNDSEEEEQEPLEEMSSMGGGAVQGFGAPLGSKKNNETFNKEQEREQRLKGDRLAEMYSTSGGRGQSVVADVTGEEEHEGHVEKSKHQGLKNVTMEEKGDLKQENVSFKVKILPNPRKNAII